MPHISIKAEELFHIAGFPITNTLILSLLILGLISLGAFLLKRRLTLSPGKTQNFIEFILEGALSLMDSVLGSRRRSEQYLPFIATIFILVLFSNWFGLIPGVGSIGVREIHGDEVAFAPFLRAPSSDLNFTLAIAITTVLAINILGVAAIGIIPHISKFFNFKSPISFFIGILELISEAAKIVSFSFRLFGNIFAGEVLLVITAFLVPYLVPLPFLMLEVFVGFIQAFVFAMLSLVFVAMATMEHESAH